MGQKFDPFEAEHTFVLSSDIYLSLHLLGLNVMLPAKTNLLLQLLSNKMLLQYFFAQINPGGDFFVGVPYDVGLSLKQSVDLVKTHFCASSWFFHVFLGPPAVVPYLITMALGNYPAVFSSLVGHGRTLAKCADILKNYMLLFVFSSDDQYSPLSCLT